MHSVTSSRRYNTADPEGRAMATAPSAKLTEADLLAMPDDGVERWLIRGELREKYPE